MCKMIAGGHYLKSEDAYDATVLSSILTPVAHWRDQPRSVGIDSRDRKRGIRSHGERRSSYVPLCISLFYFVRCPMYVPVYCYVVSISGMSWDRNWACFGPNWASFGPPMGHDIPPPRNTACPQAVAMIMPGSHCLQTEECNLRCSSWCRFSEHLDCLEWKYGAVSVTLIILFS
jgi:hypothetical protein